MSAEVFDDDRRNPSVAMSNATDLKLELKRILQSIDDGDDFETDATIDQVLKLLNSLKEMESKSFDSVISSLVAIPKDFCCPISRQLMADPVVLSTGMTCDRRHILNRLNEGHLTCPVTNQLLSDTVLTPNLLVRDLIEKWCIKNEIDVPKPMGELEEEMMKESKCVLLKILLDKMCSSLSVQKEAAKELRLLTKTMWFFRPLFRELPNALPKLLNPLSLGAGDVVADTDLYEDLVAIVLNISVPYSNKKLIGENPIVIPFLIDSLKGKTLEIKRNAAAALFALSALDSNKHIIGKQGAMKPLIDLLKEGHLLPMKDAANAIYNLCILSENKDRAICHGAIETILSKIRDQKLVGHLLAILARLSDHPKAVDEMCRHGAFGCLVNILRESDCEREKECCGAIIYTIYYHYRSKLSRVSDEDDDCSSSAVPDSADDIQFTIPAESPMLAASFTSSDGR